MRRPFVLWGFLPVLLFAAPSGAQTPLTLADAMQRARTSTPEARALAAAELEAAERVRAARAGYLPRVDISESVQRGNQPVFVFSSLLSQRLFAEANFAIPSLNEPDPVTNVRTMIGVEQSIFDGGMTRHGVREAQIGREMAAAHTAAGGQDLALAAAQAFVRVLQIDAQHRATQAAVAAAESDLQRARARGEAGLATSADVLTVEVHLADARQREITARADLDIARLQLSAALGATADVPVLAPPAPPGPVAEASSLVQQALVSRLDVRQADLAIRRAENGRGAARAAFLPRVGAQGGIEYNGGNLADQRSSWFIGAEVHLNLFSGFGDSARLAAARQADLRARAERDALVRRVEVDVRTAVARLEAARAREVVGRAALAQAREAHRIVRDRYETGLATVTDVLQAAQAAFDAESRATAAELEVVLQAVALDRAVGRL